tara:strand:+ start:178 stop:741 length:564 start_codon:yes stop_codon:yes gene_type:complete
MRNLLTIEATKKGLNNATGSDAKKQAADFVLLRNSALVHAVMHDDMPMLNTLVLACRIRGSLSRDIVVIRKVIGNLWVLTGDKAAEYIYTAYAKQDKAGKAIAAKRRAALKDTMTVEGEKDAPRIEVELHNAEVDAAVEVKTTKKASTTRMKKQAALDTALLAFEKRMIAQGATAAMLQVAYTNRQG